LVIELQVTPNALGACPGRERCRHRAVTPPDIATDDARGAGWALKIEFNHHGKWPELRSLYPNFTPDD
jgi:hypothetical protein